VMICQMLNWTARSINIDNKMINPKLVASFSVKTVVCVRKPGPTAEVAMRNAAPSRAFLFFDILKFKHYTHRPRAFQ